MVLNFRLSSELKYWSGSCFKSITGLFCLRSWTVQGALSIATYRQLQHNAWVFFVRNSSRSVGFCFLVWHQSILQTRLSVCKTLFILGRTVHERTFVDDRHWVSISRERRAMVHDGQKYNLQHSERVDGRVFKFPQENLFLHL